MRVSDSLGVYLDECVEGKGGRFEAIQNCHRAILLA